MAGAPVSAGPVPRMKPLLPVLSIGLLLLASSACSRNNKKVIAVVPKGNVTEFWQSVHAGAVKAARENGVEVAWNGTASETDFNGQLQIIESMINRHVDAIVLAPIDRTSMIGVVERSTAQGIPVFIIDSGIDTDKFVAHVETDNFHGGELAAERMGRLLHGKGKIALVKAQPGAGSTMNREDGFRSKLAQESPGIQIVAEQFGLADFAKSLQVTENILTAHPDLDALFASNESSTVGAVQALKARQGTRVRLIGFDWTAKLRDDVKSGLVEALVVQDPFRMGYQAVISAVATINGQKVEKLQHLTPKLVDRQNLDLPEIQSQLNPDLKTYLQ